MDISLSSKHAELIAQTVRQAKKDNYGETRNHDPKRIVENVRAAVIEDYGTDDEAVVALRLVRGFQPHTGTIAAKPKPAAFTEALRYHDKRRKLKIRKRKNR